MAREQDGGQVMGQAWGLREIKRHFAVRQRYQDREITWAEMRWELVRCAPAWEAVAPGSLLRRPQGRSFLPQSPEALAGIAHLSLYARGGADQQPGREGFVWCGPMAEGIFGQ
jgi:hypothetical protein